MGGTVTILGQVQHKMLKMQTREMTAKLKALAVSAGETKMSENLENILTVAHKIVDLVNGPIVDYCLRKMGLENHMRELNAVLSRCIQVLPTDVSRFNDREFKARIGMIAVHANHFAKYADAHWASLSFALVTYATSLLLYHGSSAMLTQGLTQLGSNPVVGVGMLILSTIGFSLWAVGEIFSVLKAGASLTLGLLSANTDKSVEATRAMRVSVEQGRDAYALSNVQMTQAAPEETTVNSHVKK